MNILVYPFADRPGIEKYRTIYEGWSESDKACMFLEPGDVEHRPLSHLASGRHHTICILGHCAVGGAYLRSQQSYDAKQVVEVPGHTLRADELIALLSDLGMHDNITTRIKCLNCHSGEHYDGDGDFDEESFATRLKSAMLRGDYGNVTVLGYVGALTLLPKKFPDIGVPVHKFAIMNTDQGEKAFRGKNLRFVVTGDAALDKKAANAVLRAVRSFKGETGVKL